MQPACEQKSALTVFLKIIPVMEINIKRRISLLAARAILRLVVLITACIELPSVENDCEIKGAQVVHLTRIIDNLCRLFTPNMQQDKK